MPVPKAGSLRCPDCLALPFSLHKTWCPVADLQMHSPLDTGPASLTVEALVMLARALDAMSRTEPNGIPAHEWDAIVIEGQALLCRAWIEPPLVAIRTEGVAA